MENCYLINIIFISKYKSYPFYEKLINIIREEEANKNIKTINNESNIQDDALINKLYSSLIKILFITEGLYKEKQINQIMANLQEQKKYEIIYNTYNYNETLINYPSNFEIVNKSIFDDLQKRFGLLNENNFVKCDIIVNHQKLLIKLDKKKNEQKNNLLLIGVLDNPPNFTQHYLINFHTESSRKKFFAIFLEDNYEILMNKYKSYFTSFILNYCGVKSKFLIFNENIMIFMNII